MRTVPSGGARHEFETYLLISKVDDLAAGAYHYLPMEHALELLHPVENMEAVISDALCGQSWAAKANVVFFWTIVAYRAEWRYGIYAHRPALIDAGHVGQNLYLGCTGLGLGTCGIAAFSHELCNQVFGLDGEEEFVVYTRTCGNYTGVRQGPGAGVLSVCHRRGSLTIFAFAVIPGAACAAPFAQKEKLKNLDSHTM